MAEKESEKDTQKRGVGAKPKHDYDSNDFYLALEALATRGYYDGEIADEMGLNIDVFGQMKNSRYPGWSEEQRETRGAKIRETLARARRKTNAIVRATYLRAALGTKKLTSKTTRYVEDRCECGGQDPMCPYCGGLGKIITPKAVIQETESECAPNMQALATWLHHHDPEWVKEESGATDAPPPEQQTGLNIEAWIEAMQKDRELKEKEENKTTKN